jgi:hypothetical protein
VIAFLEENGVAFEDGAIPSHKDPFRSSLRGHKSILIKPFGGHLLNCRRIEMVFLGLLNTKDSTITLFNFGSDSITLVSRIEAPNIPIKDIPATNIVIVH